MIANSMIPHNIKIILGNAVWFKLCWLACVLYGNTAAMVMLPLTLAIHVWAIPLTRLQWIFVLLVTVYGFFKDTALIGSGFMIIDDAPLLSPLWLTTIWLAFSTLIVVALNTIVTRRMLFVSLSGVAGMLSYFFGGQLSGAAFSSSQPITLAVLFCCWIVSGFILHTLYMKMRLYAPPSI